MKYTKKDIEGLVEEIMEEVDSSEMMDPDTDDNVSVAYLNGIIKECRSRIKELEDKEPEEDEDSLPN